ncbi:MBL fold metallo-hydrolase [Clostridium lacusfryxellense]|uniref:MBL fold metallo-hydrolase n=1 Tax=Clostridium lacusfryxellense TaxID=205328 RepID=UPI001C0BE5CF|nr:MBL fold metallo-hydrolase [Clostridium lacusfryxellense]MBU3113559.1 MBL fold metallo-hydrolase [Clostridium lacusfryxellense]
MDKQVITINLGMVKAFLIKGEKYILVDTGLPKSFEKIKKFLIKNGINPKDISLIILTHNHIDHTGGIMQMKDLTGAKVLIHRIEGDYLQKGISTPVQVRSVFAKLIIIVMKDPIIESFKADLLIEDNFNLNEFGVNGEVIHTPGHTAGSLSVLLNNGETIVGDMISGKDKKKFTTAKYPFIWNNINDLRNSINMLLSKGAKVFYNSHGDVCDDTSIKNLLEKDKGI